MDQDRFDLVVRRMAPAASRRSMLHRIAAVAAVAGVARALPAAACGDSAESKKKTKTCLCHISGGGVDGSVICVGGKAAKKHMKHGDALCDGVAANCEQDTAPGAACTVAVGICDTTRVCTRDSDCTVAGNAACACGPTPARGGERTCANVMG